jgi:hypothetical protein
MNFVLLIINLMILSANLMDLVLDVPVVVELGSRIVPNVVNQAQGRPNNGF